MESAYIDPGSCYLTTDENKTISVYMAGMCVCDPDVPGLQAGEVKGKRQPRSGGQVEISGRPREEGRVPGCEHWTLFPLGGQREIGDLCTPTQDGAEGSCEAERG